MNSRDRVLSACNHVEPDLVPLDYWGTKTMTEKIINHFGLSKKDELLGKIGSDLRYIKGPEYIGPPLKTNSDGSKEDIWGVWRKTKSVTATGAIYKNVARTPLANVKSVEEVDNYDHWPSANWFDFSNVEEQCEQYTNKAIIFSGGRLNRTSQLKTAIYLRGLQQIMEDMYFNPSILKAILDKIITFYLNFNEKLFEKISDKLDIFMMGDDFGMQDNLFCSKNHWVEFFKPGLKKFIDQAKKYNLLVMHHSCGAIAPLITDFIDLGLDILNPIQIEANGMEPAYLKKKYGKYITFHGGISIQKVLPHGTQAEVKENVKILMNTLGEKGGYIACTTHNLQEDIPLKNIEALFEAYDEYRIFK